ncbi:hypothetical protein [Alkalimarinus alittae]|uniref:Tyr recombinase domain-containing protein n=1 Tax=Alkalimarinus alittae TaxID=2961619 RepID=A0ABY6MXC7_9ALTE|nr:hypothetical protein [Alkalimarinus alittae]UZE94484.1 hypothetical protein NKI27_10295 [Alkalimarinus alittae]
MHKENQPITQPVNKIERYLHAATRDNTRQSYQSAIEHFEVRWGGFLPATAEQVARYLADFAESLSLNTLKQRLVGIAQWHVQQGFPDPTKTPIVKKILKGIAEEHPYTEKQAKPLQLEELKQVVAWLDQKLLSAQSEGSPQQLLLLKRNKALLLLGFWRGFRSDELSGLQLENISVSPGTGMDIKVQKSKTDRSSRGRHMRAPALSQLCPVDAYQDWLTVLNCQQGPVFRAVSRWGVV